VNARRAPVQSGAYRALIHALHLDHLDALLAFKERLAKHLGRPDLFGRHAAKLNPP
jgi:hypothetical protein